MQDLVGACFVIGLLWLVIKLAFGGSPSQSSAQGAGAGGRGAGLNSVSKESAAAQAWRESKDERQRQLKKRKQEMIEEARRLSRDQKSYGERAFEGLHDELRRANLLYSPSRKLLEQEQTKQSSSSSNSNSSINKNPTRASDHPTSSAISA